MQQRMGELTKDLDAFYTIFIKQFQALEREIAYKCQSRVSAAARLDKDVAKVMSPQMKEILAQVSTEPYLVNLLPHLIKFVESKSTSLMDPTQEAIPGDVAIHDLILQVLRAVFQNKFFDLDFSLKIVIPILMNLTTCAKFHEKASIEAILRLKQLNAELLGTLIERFHQKYSLKVGYAEFLLKHILQPNDGEE